MLARKNRSGAWSQTRSKEKHVAINTKIEFSIYGTLLGVFYDLRTFFTEESYERN